MGSRIAWIAGAVLAVILHCAFVGGFRLVPTDTRNDTVDEVANVERSMARYWQSDTGSRDLLQADQTDQLGDGTIDSNGDANWHEKKQNDQSSSSEKQQSQTSKAGEQQGTEREGEKEEHLQLDQEKTKDAADEEKKAQPNQEKMKNAAEEEQKTQLNQEENKTDETLAKAQQEQQQPPKVEPVRTLKKPGPEENEGKQAAEEDEPFDYPKPYLLGPTITDWDQQRGAWLEANPQMKSTPAGKPRVLIVTGSKPEPCKSPTGDNFHIKALKLKIDYARIHKYEIYYNLVHLDPLFDRYWVKLPTIRTLMLSHPEIEWFFWVDSDAVFTDMLFEPPLDMYEGYNMVMWGSETGLLKRRSWVAYNAGVFLIRNCQWSLDLIDKWSPFGPNGPVRVQYGKVFSKFLTWRADNFPADDQSALAYLIINDEAVRSKVKLVESQYLMSGFWLTIVDRYEEMMDKYHPGLGDRRWPWITHFTGCGPCAGGDNPDYSFEKCMSTFGKAYNFADNQVLAFMGYRHESLYSHTVVRTRNDTDHPLDFVDVNPWADRISATKLLPP